MCGPMSIELNREFEALVAFLQKRGFEREPAKDAASEAMAAAYQRWRKTLRRLVVTDEQDLHSWAGQQLWDEVQRRRHKSPLTAYPWALDALADLGIATKQMMVVVDPDGVVLWRGGCAYGHPEPPRRARPGCCGDAWLSAAPGGNKRLCRAHC